MKGRYLAITPDTIKNLAIVLVWRLTKTEERWHAFLILMNDEKDAW